MNKNGASGILDDNNKEFQLRSLIVEFDEKHNLKSKISYKGIYDYVVSSYNEKKIDFYPSYTWWKTKGKYLVDEFNTVKTKTIQFGEHERLDIIEIMDLVDKHCGDKEALIRYLLPYNNLVERLVDRIGKLENAAQQLSSRIESKDDVIQKYENKFKKQESLIDSLFYNQISSESELKLVMQMGQTTSEVLNCSLKETFESPKAYITEFTKRSVENMKNNYGQKDNVILLQGKDSMVPEEEDYDW